MLEALDIGANPSSVHQAGRSARRILERARSQLGLVIGVQGQDMIFTSGGTESNRIALSGAVQQIKRAGGEHPIILSTKLEHSAVLDQLPGGEDDFLEVGALENGQIDLSDLQAKLDTAKARGSQPVLALMLANNETGVIQPVAEAARLTRQYGGLVHCDAVQALGKIPVNVMLLGVDYLALSGHKCGGPSGVGALWVRPGAPLRPLHGGGGQERSLRSGTENLSGIAGFGAAAMKSVEDLERFAQIEAMRNQLEADLRDAGAVVFGDTSHRLANTSCFAFPGFRAETQVMALDLAGVAISAGAACSSGKVKSSGVLEAMSVSAELAECAVRVSFGWNSEKTDGHNISVKWRESAMRAGLL